MKTKPHVKFLILIIGLMNTAHSQTWDWAKKISGTNDESGINIHADRFGNIYATGLFSDSITLGASTYINDGFDEDCFIIKCDVSGNMNWSKSIQGNSSEYIREIKTDASGNLYVQGEFFSDSVIVGNLILKGSGSLKSFIAVFDSSGNNLWGKCIRGGYVEAGGLDLDPNGNIYLGGYFADTLIFDSDTIFGSGDMYILKINPSGNLIHSIKSTGMIDDAAWDICTDGFGNVYSTGYFQGDTVWFGSLFLLNNSFFESDVFIVKYDSSGHELWARCGTGSDYEFIQGCACDPFGNVFVTGWFYSPEITFDGHIISNSNNQSGDLFIVKYDSSGNFQWGINEGGAYDEYGYELITDSLGNLFLAAVISSPALTIGSNSFNCNGDDGLVAKFDSSGTVLWAKQIQGGNDDECYGITLDNQSNIYVTGSFLSQNIFFGTTPLINSSVGSYDMYIAKLSELSTEISPNQKDNLLKVITRNLSEHKILISCEMKMERVEIYNSSGQLVYNASPNKWEAIIELKNAGIYFIKIQAHEIYVSKKMFVD